MLYSLVLVGALIGGAPSSNEIASAIRENINNYFNFNVKGRAGAFEYQINHYI
jgi:hypothetical protein